jgi:penicillin amidase
MRIFKRTLLVLITLLFILIVSVWFYLNHQSPIYEGIISDLDLKNKTEVYFDTYGIPHIYAENKEDAYKVLGYIHAQDRLFQMDLMRKVGAGRLSELFGKDVVDIDKFFRTLGIGRRAKEQLASVKADISDPTEILIVDAYLEGINSFIDNGVLPVEYKLLGIVPEHFQWMNLLETSGFMAFTFAFTLKTEPATDFVLKNYPDSGYVAGMDIDFDPHRKFIPNYSKADSIMAALSVSYSDMMAEMPIPTFQGSNSWALAPSRTKSGKVLFSNDTHMKFSQPAVWYESHIEYPGFSFYGNFLPGVPFALVGHNRDMAWGLTMFENDDADLYFETIDTTNNTYLYDGDWKEIAIYQEEIKIKGEEALLYEVRETPNGPIISDFLKADLETPVSYWWTYLKFKPTLLDAFYLLNTAENLEQAEKAASLIKAPGLNINYGDAEGNIAWWACAKMVKRPDGMQSMAIHDGSNPEEHLSEYWEFKDNPQSINPPWGYIYSSNNQSGMMPDSTWYPGYYAPENRARKITELIESKDKWSLEEMKTMITDVNSIVEREVNSALCSYIDISELDVNQKGALDWLQKWDGNHAVDRGEPVLYYRWIQLVLKSVYLDEFGEDLFKVFTSAHRHKRSYPIVFEDSNSPWWNNVNTPKNENAQDIATATFKEAIDRCNRDWGANYSQWQWGEAHQLYFEHPLGKVDALRDVFNVGPYPSMGGNETINNSGFDMTSEERISTAFFGPQMRIIIDFADVEQSLSINPSGQSGNIMSPHYDDQAEMFAKGIFRKQLMDKEMISKGTKLIFKPSN